MSDAGHEALAAARAEVERSAPGVEVHEVFRLRTLARCFSGSPATPPGGGRIAGPRQGAQPAPRLGRRGRGTARRSVRSSFTAPATVDRPQRDRRRRRRHPGLPVSSSSSPTTRPPYAACPDRAAVLRGRRAARWVGTSFPPQPSTPSQNGCCSPSRSRGWPRSTPRSGVHCSSRAACPRRPCAHRRADGPDRRRRPPGRAADADAVRLGVDRGGRARDLPGGRRTPARVG